MRFYFRDPKFCTLNAKKPPWYLNLCTVRMRLTKFLSHLSLSRNSGYGNNWFRMGPVAPWTCSSPLKAEGGFISMRRAPKEKPFCIYCFSKAAVICPTSRILHCSMLIFQRDNFSTISTPAIVTESLLWAEPQGAIRCAKLNNGSMLRPGSFTVNNTPWSSRPARLSTQHLVSLPPWQLFKISINIDKVKSLTGCGANYHGFLHFLPIDCSQNIRCKRMPDLSWV